MDEDVCLQCSKTRAETRDPFNAICATASGYEVVETLDEWDRHHWRDWSDSELSYYGILPEYYEEHRRDVIYDLPYAPCEHTERGHNIPTDDVYIGGWLMHEADRCIDCGKDRDGDY